MVFVPSEDSDQTGHPPSLNRVFAVRIKNHWILSYPQNAHGKLWSDWADAKADLSLRWAHSYFVGFVVLRLISFYPPLAQYNNASIIWKVYFNNVSTLKLDLQDTALLSMKSRSSIKMVLSHGVKNYIVYSKYCMAKTKIHLSLK